MNCQYHPIYRNCFLCGREMERGTERECWVSPPRHAPSNERVVALRQARALIKEHAKMTWNTGQIERSDGITDVLVDFDLKFPEAIEP